MAFFHAVIECAADKVPIGNLGTARNFLVQAFFMVTGHVQAFQCRCYVSVC
jgi:hypothetical protein